jgi:DNA polymerase-1
LKKVYPKFQPRGRIMDTFVIAAMRWAHIKDDDYARAREGKFPSHLAGLHKLEAWGVRLGILKKTFDYKGDGAFEVWTPEMQALCEQDVDVTEAIVRLIRKEGVSLESLEIEHELAEYLECQEQNGWPFDEKRAAALQAKLSARREYITTQLQEALGPIYVKSDTPHIPKKDNKKRGIVAGYEYQNIKLVPLNPGSRTHIARKLTTLYGWKPTAFTPKGAPEINEETLNSLPQHYAGVKLLVEYFDTDKLLGMVAEGDEAWLRHTRLNPETGLQHIHGRVKQGGTITHRASHVSPNVAQTPKVLALKDGTVLYGPEGNYGADCRELWCVPPGWVQIGADVSGLEARNLGHYMAAWDGGEYAKLLLEGDVHTKNLRALGFPETKQGRDVAKTWYYAWMFGAGDEKLGRIASKVLKISPKRYRAWGREAKQRFLADTPVLAHLISAVQRARKDKGYVLMPDGRRAYIRSDHSALNTLIQASGAVVCRRWIVDFNRELIRRYGPQGWRGQWAALAWVHDEVQIAVRPELAKEVCCVLVEAIRGVTQKFGWRVPLDGEAKIGNNWCQTH